MAGRSSSPGELGLDDRAASRPATNRLAIAALAITIVIPIIGGIPGLIMGYKARAQIRARNQAGRWVAIAAIVIGWLSVVYILVFVIFFAVGVFRGLDSPSPG